MILLSDTHYKRFFKTIFGIKEPESDKRKCFGAKVSVADKQWMDFPNKELLGSQKGSTLLRSAESLFK